LNEIDHRPKGDNPDDPATVVTPAGGPLSDLVKEEVKNRSLADEIVEAVEHKPEEPSRSDTEDYAHGTAEHEDDREV
jgi:hypothetical protein